MFVQLRIVQNLINVCVALKSDDAIKRAAISRNLTRSAVLPDAYFHSSFLQTLTDIELF